MKTKIVIKGPFPTSARERVLLIGNFTRQVCEQADKDPAEGIMMLLTAACHLHTSYLPEFNSNDERIKSICEVLGNALAAADGFFPLPKKGAHNDN